MNWYLSCAKLTFKFFCPSNQIYADRTALATKEHYVGESYVGSSTPPATIHLGCVKTSDGHADPNSVVQNVEVASVALWYWPVKTLQYLTGGLGTSRVIIKPADCTGHAFLKNYF